MKLKHLQFSTVVNKGSMSYFLIWFSRTVITKFSVVQDAVGSVATSQINPELKLLSMQSSACSIHVHVGLHQFPSTFQKHASSWTGDSTLPIGARCFTMDRYPIQGLFPHRSQYSQVLSTPLPWSVWSRYASLHLPLILNSILVNQLNNAVEKQEQDLFSAV